MVPIVNLQPIMNTTSLVTIGLIRRMMEHLTVLRSTPSFRFKGIAPLPHRVLSACAALCLMMCQSAWAAVVTETFTTSGFSHNINDVNIICVFI